MDISSLLTIKAKEIARESIHFTPKTFLWCTLPYPDHPKGCPNYDKNPLCPPHSSLMHSKLNGFRYFYLVYGKFQLKRYIEQMRERHPTWSHRQASCVLYWQGSVKKHLKNRLKQIAQANTDIRFYLFSSGSGFKEKIFGQSKIYSMEAAGIDVFRTLKANGIAFEVKPRRFVLLVNMLCATKKIQIS
jgi:predicted metal-binding protein